MPRWTCHESTVRRIAYTVPTPAAHADITQALDAAAGRWFREHGKSVGEDFPDDALTVTATDDAVVISFEVTE